MLLLLSVVSLYVLHLMISGMIGAAAAAAGDDDGTSCTGLITERLYALGLGFNTVSPVLVVLEEVLVVTVL